MTLQYIPSHPDHLPDPEVESLNDDGKENHDDLDLAQSSRRHFSSSRVRPATASSRPGGGLVRKSTSASARSNSGYAREASTKQSDSTTDVSGREDGLEAEHLPILRRGARHVSRHGPDRSYLHFSILQLAAFLLATGPPGEPPSRMRGGEPLPMEPPSPISSLSSRRSGNFLSRAKNAFGRKASESTLKGPKSNDAARREAEKAKERLFDEQLRMASLTKKVLPDGTSFYKFDGQPDNPPTDSAESFYSSPASAATSTSKTGSSSLGGQAGRAILTQQNSWRSPSPDGFAAHRAGTRSRPGTARETTPLDVHQESGKSYDTVQSSPQGSRTRSATHSGTTGSPFDDHTALRDLPPLPLPVVHQVDIVQSTSKIGTSGDFPSPQHSRSVSLVGPAGRADQTASITSSKGSDPENALPSLPADPCSPSIGAQTISTTMPSSLHTDVTSNSSLASRSERPRSSSKRMSSLERNSPLNSPLRARVGVAQHLHHHMRSPSLLDGGDASARREEEAAMQEIQRSIGVNGGARNGSVDQTLSNFLEARHGSVDQGVSSYNSLPRAFDLSPAESTDPEMVLPIESAAQESTMRPMISDVLAKEGGDNEADPAKLTASSDPHQLFEALLAARTDAERARELCARALELLRADVERPLAPAGLESGEGRTLDGDLNKGDLTLHHDAPELPHQLPSSILGMSPFKNPSGLPSIASDASHSDRRADVLPVEEEDAKQPRARMITVASEEEEELKHGGYALTDPRETEADTEVERETALLDEAEGPRNTSAMLLSDEDEAAAPPARFALIEELAAFLAEKPNSAQPIEDLQPAVASTQSQPSARDADAAFSGIEEPRDVEIADRSEAEKPAEAEVVSAEKATDAAIHEGEAGEDALEDDDPDRIPEAVPIHYPTFHRLRPEEVPAFPHEAARRLVELEKQSRRGSILLGSKGRVSLSGSAAAAGASGTTSMESHSHLAELFVPKRTTSQEGPGVA